MVAKWSMRLEFLQSNSMTPSGPNPGVTTIFSYILFLFFVNFPVNFKKLDKYAKFYQAKPRHYFAYQWLDNVKINKYEKLVKIYHAV